MGRKSSRKSSRTARSGQKIRVGRKSTRTARREALAQTSATTNAYRIAATLSIKRHQPGPCEAKLRYLPSRHPGRIQAPGNFLEYRTSKQDANRHFFFPPFFFLNLSYKTPGSPKNVFARESGMMRTFDKKNLGKTPPPFPHTPQKNLGRRVC